MTAPPLLPDVSVFVAPTGNGFMRDIADWIAEAARSDGRRARVVDDRLPALDGAINLVVAPHEFFELFDAPKQQLQRAAAASVCICTEQPGTPWFHLSVDACRRGLLSFDINPHGVDALRDVGVNAQWLALGGVAGIEAQAGRARTSNDRPIDLLFMGGLDDRRGAILADLAPRLFDHDVALRLFRFDRPVTSATPGVVFGADKYELLSKSKVLLNLHRDRSMHLPTGTEPRVYFEWARMVEVMANGCVVLTEPSEGFEPLIAGVHFVEAPANDLGNALDDLIGDRARRKLIADAAYAEIMGPLALCRAVGAALRLVEATVLPRLGEHFDSGRPTAGLWRLGATKVAPPVRLGAFRPYLPLQRAAKRLALEENRALRRLDQAECLLVHGQPQRQQCFESKAYAATEPDVSVVVTVYNYAEVVTDTLASIAASTDIAFEIVVVDDHATDRSRSVVEQFMDHYPAVATLLVGKEANEGLAAARNTGFAQARAPKVMIMDADNQVYPTCLRKLADALDDRPGTAAVYAILEDFGTQRNVRSALAWDVERLCAANYIDAQAMWRRSDLQSLGGYRDDDEFVYGWEDWDLWLRLADSRGRAALVPQILGRYRVQESSMISLTNLATDEAIAAMRLRYPSLPWPREVSRSRP